MILAILLSVYSFYVFIAFGDIMEKNPDFPAKSSQQLRLVGGSRGFINGNAGNFIFYRDSDNDREMKRGSRKLVLTNNQGVSICSGELLLPATSWTDPKTWQNKDDNHMTIQNFVWINKGNIIYHFIFWILVRYWYLSIMVMLYCEYLCIKERIIK